MAAFEKTGVELVVKNASGFFSTLDKASGKAGDFGKKMAKAAATGVAAFGAAIAGVGAVSIKAAVGFESAFAGVIKTTDGLVDEMGNLTEAGEETRKGFRDLAKEVPTAVEELLAIGELGGQLGIAQEGLIDFTKTIAAMGETTNLTTEEAATGFAQLANIMQTPQDQISNMGSAVVALGNNFATTERDIVTFSSRIAGAGEIAGLTEAQVFGIGAAMSSVGVQAEAGGTAVQKVLLAMNEAAIGGGEQMQIFAAVAGIEADKFGTAWETDAGVVFTQFVEGLGLAGDDAIGILSELGLEDQRLIRSFLSLAGAGELLNESMDLSTEAFRENTALTKEAEIRYKTTAAQFDIFKNVIKDVAITIGDALLPFVNKMLTAAKPLIEEFGKKLPGFLNETLIPAIESVAKWLGENIPAAIEEASKFWTDTLQPALEDVWDFVESTVLPIIKDLVDWLQESIPIAIQEASRLWTNTLQPALKEVQAFIVNQVIPAIERIVSWLQDKMPIAFQAVSDIWHNTLQPALSGLWNFIINSVIPAASDLFDWLNVSIPIAFSAVKRWWETTLRPALENLRGFIEDDVIPIVEKVVEWFKDKIPEAWDAVKKAWDDPLKGILENAVESAEDVRLKIKEVVEWFAEKIPEAWGAVKAAWDDPLKGIFESIVEFIGNIIEKVGEVVGWFSEKIPEAYKTAKTAWEKDLRPALEGVLGFINDIIGAVGRAVQAIENLLSLTAGADLDDPSGPGGAMPGVPGAGGLPDLLRVAETVERVMNRVIEQLINAFNSIDDITTAMSEGFEAGFEDLFEIPQKLLKTAGIFGGLGAAAAKRLKDQLRDSEELLAIEEELATLDERILEHRAAMVRLEERIAREKRGIAEAATREEREERARKVRELLEFARLAEEDLVRLEARRADIAESHAEVVAERAADEERILQLQKAQQNLRFLEQQLKLLELVRKEGLDIGDILGGVKLGLDADLPGIVDAMTRAMNAMIERAQEELGIGSPSQVFADIGRGVMEGLASGVKSLRSLPALEVQSATSRMIAAPAVAGPSVMNNNEFNLGGNTIQGEMDMATFESRVIRIIERAVRG